MHKNLISILNNAHKTEHALDNWHAITHRLSQKHESARQHFKLSQEATKHHDEGNLDNSSIHTYDSHLNTDTKPAGVVLETHLPDDEGA